MVITSNMHSECYRHIEANHKMPLHIEKSKLAAGILPTRFDCLKLWILSLLWLEHPTQNHWFLNIPKKSIYNYWQIARHARTWVKTFIRLIFCCWLNNNKPARISDGTISYLWKKWDKVSEMTENAALNYWIYFIIENGLIKVTKSTWFFCFLMQQHNVVHRCLQFLWYKSNVRL